jgi:hypothetical protein
MRWWTKRGRDRKGRPLQREDRLGTCCFLQRAEHALMNNHTMIYNIIITVIGQGIKRCHNGKYQYSPYLTYPISDVCALEPLSTRLVGWYRHTYIRQQKHSKASEKLMHISLSRSNFLVFMCAHLSRSCVASARHPRRISGAHLDSERTPRRRGGSWNR